MNRFLEFVKLSKAEEIKGFTNNFYRLKYLMHDGDQLIMQQFNPIQPNRNPNPIP